MRSLPASRRPIRRRSSARGSAMHLRPRSLRRRRLRCRRRLRLLANARRSFRLRPSARPNRLEACAPARQRAAAQRAREGLGDHLFSDLPALLRPGDVLVFNDTRVIPAQLEGRRGEARIGATLHKREGPREWRAFVRNAKRAARRRPDRLRIRRRGIGRRAAQADGSALLRFRGRRTGRVAARTRRHDAAAALYRRRRDADERDRDDYQTMFAREEGAVAAPTAALHFTPAPDRRRSTRAGIGQRDADPACRRRHLPAGQGGGYRRSPDARRMGPDRRPTAGTPERRCDVRAGG